MNGDYDFSTIGSGGEIIYNNREITVKFGIPSKNKTALYSLYSNISEWLLGVGKSQLIFDDIEDYYYNAEIEAITSFEEVFKFGKFEAKIIAEPFKFSLNNVGDDIWDTFNFEEDIAQDNEFDVVTTSNIMLYNVGVPVFPVITCSNNMSIIFNSITYNLVVGDNINIIKLATGENTIIVNGTGNIKFAFQKVRL